MGYWSSNHFSWVDRDSLLVFSDFLPFYLAHLSLAHHSYREMCIFVCHVTNALMSFPHLFIRSLVEVHRSSSSTHAIFFLVLIHWILLHLGLEEFPTFELVHIIAPICATFLRQKAIQMRLALNVLELSLLWVLHLILLLLQVIQLLMSMLIWLLLLLLHLLLRMIRAFVVC